MRKEMLSLEKENVEFDDIEDPERQRYFEQISTSFTLPDQEVDDLRAVARELMLGSPVYQALVNELNN